jgi:CRISPR-associated protein Cas1
VFDVADLVKDATILPQAFISAMRGETEQEFRSACIENLTRTEALDFMIDTLKEVAIKTAIAVEVAAAATASTST